jgi:hypothetical protein
MLWDPAFVLSSSMLILFHLDSSLCNVSPSSRTPTPGADQAQGGTVGHDQQVSPGEVAHCGGASTPGKAATAGTEAPKAPEVVAGDGSPAPAPDMSAAAGTTVAVSIGSSVDALSPQPQLGVASTSTVVGDDIVDEPEAIQWHPLLRAPGDVSLDEAMGTARWALNQA